MPVITDADDLRLGSLAVDRVYLGETPVWPWTPAIIPGLVAWFDPTQDSFADGEPIQTYVEHSPAGRVFNAQYSGAAPIFHAGGGRPYLEFWTAGGGSGGFVGAALWNPGTAGLTFVWVCQITGGSFPMMLVWGPDANGIEMRHDGSAQQIVLLYGNTGIYYSHPTPTGGGTDHVYMLRVVAGSRSEAWTNGVKHTDNRGVTMPNINDTLWIGRRQGGYNFIGRMYEGLVFAGPISDANQAVLSDYLTEKWGLP